MKKLVVCVASIIIMLSSLMVNIITTSALPDYEKIDMSAMLSSMVRPSENKGALTDKFLHSDGTEKSLSYASFQLLYGKVEGDMLVFENFGGSGMNADNDQVWAYGDTIGASGVGFWRWQVRARAGDDAIFKIVLKEDCDLTIGHNAITNAWDLTKKLTLYKEVVSEKGKEYIKIDEKSQNQVNAEADLYRMDIAYAKAGETYYYCISSENPTGGTSPIINYFQFSKHETDFRMDGGASIRLSEPNGIRFTARMAKVDYESFVAKFGEENVKFGMDILRGDGASLDIIAEKFYEENGYIVFSCVVMNIAEERYTTTYQGKGYILLSGVKTYAAENDNVRTIAAVAQAALEDETKVWTDEQLQLLEQFAGRV